VRPRSAATLLARGWLRDARRWAWSASLVLAGTLGLMIGAAGILEGTEAETLERVADFYTGDLRITRDRPGALPPAWFDLNKTTGPDGGGGLAKAGRIVSYRVEAQYVMSRRGFLEAALLERDQFIVEAPGSAGNATEAIALGSLVGLDAGDPGRALLERHLVAGRMPRESSNDTLEVVMSLRRLSQFLTPGESAAAANIAPMTVAGALNIEATSAQVDLGNRYRLPIRRSVEVVGLYDTSVDVLDGYTMIAAAPDVRAMVARPPHERSANAIAVWGETAGLATLGKERNWAVQGPEGFAQNYVGETMAILSAVVVFVGAVLFLIPTFLVSHGLARQLAAQQRELAVCTAIGVPARVLRNALGLEVLRIGLGGLLIAAALVALGVWLLPGALANVHGAPLPLGFALSLTAVGSALLVTLLSMAIGLFIGVRSRRRLGLAAQLRAV
jgi:hypothetical protein